MTGIGPEQSAEYLTLDNVHREHRILSGHRCSCGWEGDSPTTHIIDALGLERVGWMGVRWDDAMERDEDDETAPEPPFLAATDGDFRFEYDPSDWGFEHLLDAERLINPQPVYRLRAAESDSSAQATAAADDTPGM